MAIVHNAPMPLKSNERELVYIMKPELRKMIYFDTADAAAGDLRARRHGEPAGRWLLDYSTL